MKHRLHHQGSADAFMVDLVNVWLVTRQRGAPSVLLSLTQLLIKLQFTTRLSNLQLGWRTGSQESH